MLVIVIAIVPLPFIGSSKSFIAITLDVDIKLS